MDPQRMTPYQLDLEVAAMQALNDIVSEFQEKLRAQRDLYQRQGAYTACEAAASIHNYTVDAVADHWRPDMESLQDELNRRPEAM